MFSMALGTCEYGQSYWCMPLSSTLHELHSASPPCCNIAVGWTMVFSISSSTRLYCWSCGSGCPCMMKLGVWGIIPEDHLGSAVLHSQWPSSHRLRTEPHNTSWTWQLKSCSLMKKNLCLIARAVHIDWSLSIYSYWTTESAWPLADSCTSLVSSPARLCTGQAPEPIMHCKH